MDPHELFPSLPFFLSFLSLALPCSAIAVLARKTPLGAARSRDRVGKRKFWNRVDRRIESGRRSTIEEEEEEEGRQATQERAIYGRGKKIGAADIRERGQRAAVAISAKSYGEIDRRKS